MIKTKIGYNFKHLKFTGTNLDILMYFLNDACYNEQPFIDWCKSKQLQYGGNISFLDKLPNKKIQIRIDTDLFYSEDDEEYDWTVIMLQENFIHLLSNWRDFGKSGKEYIYLKEDDGWYSFEYPEEKKS